MSYILNKCVSCLRYIEIGPPSQDVPSSLCWACRNCPITRSINENNKEKVRKHFNGVLSKKEFGE